MKQKMNKASKKTPLLSLHLYLFLSLQISLLVSFYGSIKGFQTLLMSHCGACLGVF